MDNCKKLERINDVIDRAEKLKKTRDELIIQCDKEEFESLKKILKDGVITEGVITYIERNIYGRLTTIAYVLDKHSNDCGVMGNYQTKIEYGSVKANGDYTIINSIIDDDAIDNKMRLSIEIVAITTSERDKLRLYSIPAKSIEDFFKQISECKKDFVIIPLALQRYEGRQKRLGGHANVLIVNTKTKEVEHFEPHGSGTEYAKSKEFHKDLKEFFEGGGYKYLNIEESCPTKGLQHYETKGVKENKTIVLNDEIEIEYEYSRSGLCVFFSYALVDLRLSNPNVPILILQNRLIKLVKKSGVYMSDFILSWANFFKDVFGEKIKKLIDDVLPDAINEYVIGDEKSPTFNPVIGKNLSLKEREDKYYTEEFFDKADELMYYRLGLKSYSFGKDDEVYKMLSELMDRLAEQYFYDIYKNTTTTRGMSGQERLDRLLSTMEGEPTTSDPSPTQDMKSLKKGGSKESGVIQGISAGKPSSDWNKPLRTYPPFDITKMKNVSKNLIMKSKNQQLINLFKNGSLKHPLAKSVESDYWKKRAEKNPQLTIKNLYINPLYKSRREPEPESEAEPEKPLTQSQFFNMLDELEEMEGEGYAKGSGTKVKFFPGKKARKARNYLAKGHLAVGDVIREIAPDAVKTAMDIIRPQEPTTSDPSPTQDVKSLKGGAPPQKAFFQSAEGAYEKQAPKIISGNYSLVMDSPTFDAYVNEQSKEVLIAPRGTDPTSFEDLKADGSLAFNQLRNSRRYKKDDTMMKKLIQQYPPTQYSYYASGHSLSGAIITQMRRDYPFIKMGVAYNSAFQPQDLLTQDPTIKRIYTDKDFLYNLGGKFFKNIQVIPMKREETSGFFSKLKQKLTPDGLQGHSLSNFKPLYGGSSEPTTSDPSPTQDVKSLEDGCDCQEQSGKGILQDVFKIATGKIPKQQLESQIKNIAKEHVDIIAKASKKSQQQKQQGKGIFDTIGNTIKVYQKAIQLPGEIAQKLTTKKNIEKGRGTTENKKIDFGLIQWGTFEDLHNRFLKKNPKSDLTDLKSFAKHILANKEDFSNKAFRKALFYENIINPDKKSRKKS